MRIVSESLNVPSLRGIIHLASAVVFAGLGGWLLTSAVHNGVAIPTSIYVGGMVLAMLTSAVYHLRGSMSRLRHFWRRLDHAMILVWVAATYTPLLLVAMQSSLGAVVLGIVWGIAIVGTILRFAVARPPRWVRVGIPTLMGWLAVIVLPGLWIAAGAGVAILLIVGGVFYSLGALVYLIRRPDPLPRHFGYHELFHALVVVAAAFHFVAVAMIVHSARA